MGGEVCRGGIYAFDGGVQVSEYNWVKCSDRMPGLGKEVVVRLLDVPTEVYVLIWTGQVWIYAGSKNTWGSTEFEWLDTIPQPSKLEWLAELLRQSSKHDTVQIRPDSDGDDTWIDVAFLGADGWGWTNMTSAIYRLEQEQRTSHEKALEAMTMLREKLGMFSDDKPMLADIVLRYLEAQDE